MVDGPLSGGRGKGHHLPGAGYGALTVFEGDPQLP